MPVTITENPKAIDLKIGSVTAKSIKSAGKKSAGKKITDKKITDKKGAGKEVSRKDFVSRASNGSAKLDVSELSSKAVTSEEKAAEASKVDSISKVLDRRMVQDANQWRNCRRPHRI